MRFVAGQGTVAGRHGGASAERRRCGRETGRVNRGGAAGQCAVAERLAEAPLLQHREEIGKNLKRSRKPHMELLVEEGEEDSILFCNFGGKM